MNIRLLLFYLMLCFSQIVFSQTGTFDFSIGTTQDGKSATQTISGITLTVFSDNSTEPAPSITLQNWSAYPPFDDDVVTMNGMAKPSCTFNFSGTVNIASLLIADHFGTTNYHLLFTANTTDTYDVTIDGANGTVVTPNFIGITSFVITNYDGGNICVGCDNVVMDESLPVGLTSFTARTAGQAIILKWITESETDNLGFILERAAGNGEWQPLASYKTDAALKGQGNASTTTS
ncbi:MAG TPA: hypothetical protein PLI87_12920, partial [bacterium]|nr:hypothetical protein [bacterium]